MRNRSQAVTKKDNGVMTKATVTEFRWCVQQQGASLKPHSRCEGSVEFGKKLYE